MVFVCTGVKSPIRLYVSNNNNNDQLDVPSGAHFFISRRFDGETVRLYQLYLFIHLDIKNRKCVNDQKRLRFHAFFFFYAQNNFEYKHTFMDDDDDDDESLAKV